MTNLSPLVSDYLQNHLGNTEEEWAWFKTQPNLHKAIKVSILAVDQRGKRLPHQRRIPEEALRRACAALLFKATEINNCRNFSELHEIVHATIKPIHGIGELVIYDTALRIGAFLGIEPTEVFIHAGTRSGAKALGFKAPMKALDMRTLPIELQSLEPHQVEDFLCIYKDKIKIGS